MCELDMVSQEVGVLGIMGLTLTFDERPRELVYSSAS